MRNRPTFPVSYFSYAVVFSITTFFMIFYEQTFFALLFLIEIALPFLTHILLKQSFMQISPALQFRPLITTKGETAYLTISFENKSRIPVGSCRFDLTIFSQFYDESKEEDHIMPLRAKSDNTITFPIKLNKCGLYQVKMNGYILYDFLHLSSCKKEVNLTADLYVYPDTTAKYVRHEAIYNEGFDEFEESQKKGNVSSNVTDIREYQPGDRLQKIHWKLSEKIDKLMVKENEATSSNEFFLLLELFQPKKEDCLDNVKLYHALDVAIDEAYAISLELIEAGEIFIFAVYSTKQEDFVMSTIRNKEDLQQALNLAYFESCYETENLALDIYERSGMKKGTVLHVTHKGVDDVIA